MMENLERNVLEENNDLSVMNQTDDSKKEEKVKKKSEKKNRKSKDKTLDDFDIRGTQTLFRTLSRNHYNLLRMVDNKANIVLTMNSIIISLLMGALYLAPEEEKAIVDNMAKVIINFGMVSMIFALISMLPHKYIGRTYKNSGYKGSLYAGNYARKPLEDFEIEFKRIMNSGDNIYNEMIKDLYFLGKSVYIKQKLLWLSVTIFLVGLIGSLLYHNITTLLF